MVGEGVRDCMVCMGRHGVALYSMGAHAGAWDCMGLYGWYGGLLCARSYCIKGLHGATWGHVSELDKLRMAYGGIRVDWT